jgi:hypothetical protein
MNQVDRTIQDDEDDDLDDDDFELPSPTDETYASFYEAFRWFNMALFQETLPDCLITVQRSKRSYGYFASERFGRRDGAIESQAAPSTKTGRCSPKTGSASTTRTAPPCGPSIRSGSKCATPAPSARFTSGASPSSESSARIAASQCAVVWIIRYSGLNHHQTVRARIISQVAGSNPWRFFAKNAQ